MDAVAEELVDRVRALLADGPAIEERRMFGTRAFLRDGHILVCVRKNGALLVRVTEDHGASLLARPGAALAVMGTRTMGPSWLEVEPEVLRDDEELMFWLDAAREDAEELG